MPAGAHFWDSLTKITFPENSFLAGNLINSVREGKLGRIHLLLEYDMMPTRLKHLDRKNSYLNASYGGSKVRIFPYMVSRVGRAIYSGKRLLEYSVSRQEITGLIRVHFFYTKYCKKRWIFKPDNAVNLSRLILINLLTKIALVWKNRRKTSQTSLI